MSKIFVVSSSMRRGGNSDVLCDEFIRGAEESGNEVERLDLRDIDIRFCRGCLACRNIKKCIQRDSINEILDMVQNSDIIVFATPVYYYAVCGQLKTFIDRLNPLFYRTNRFKKVYLLATSAEDDKAAMEGAIKDIQGWVDCHDGVTLTDIVYGTGLENVGDVNGSSAKAEAYELGKIVK